MDVLDLRPMWKEELRHLEEKLKLTKEQISVLKAKIEGANEIFSPRLNGEGKGSWREGAAGLPLFPSLSKTVAMVIRDHGVQEPLTIEDILGKLYQYGINPNEVKRTTVYTLANRLWKQGAVTKGTGAKFGAKFDALPPAPKPTL
ncbi:hypothetical protein [Verrucomicrobium sp. GAS474]|uniref:hypothetical protein n=1 Tax=Verrucomicrobium sp. GAS474 TaxID=1882831 RepID=UPI0012FFC224|nr:hypothetical protein [Verrucomicrobium sp. GAS474]